MKIVLDTNVIISAFISSGLANRVFEKCIEKHKLFISDWIITEVTEKLENKFRVPENLIEKIKNYFETYFNRIDLKNIELPYICRDKDDNNILALAKLADVDIIITGDKDLLILKEYQKIKIIDPRKYYDDFEIIKS